MKNKNSSKSKRNQTVNVEIGKKKYENEHLSHTQNACSAAPTVLLTHQKKKMLNKQDTLIRLQ
jgi:patatin-like phospholipase/acyl hydrolase